MSHCCRVNSRVSAVLLDKFKPYPVFSSYTYMYIYVCVCGVCTVCVYRCTHLYIVNTATLQLSSAPLDASILLLVMILLEFTEYPAFN